MHGEVTTVGDLKQLLDQYDDDQPVRLMEQPSWPFEYSIGGVTSRSEFAPGHPFQPGQDDEAEECQFDGPDGQCHDAEDDDVHGDSQKDTVFILEGGQECYGTKQAWGGY